MNRSMCYFGFLILLMIGVYEANAGTYKFEVKRIDSNLYQVCGKDILIQTAYCYEYGYGENVFLSMDGTTGSIVFLSNGTKYDVKGVYGVMEKKEGTFKATVSRDETDWYEIIGRDIFIKTSMCFEFVFMEEVVLNISPLGRSTIIFKNGTASEIEALYKKLNL